MSSTGRSDVRAVLEGSAQWAIVHGDCLDVLRELPDRSVAHVITDPPYSDHVHTKSRAGARKVPLTDGAGRMPRSAISRAVDLGFDAITGEQIVESADQFARLVNRWTLVFSNVELAHRWREELTASGLDYVRTGVWVKEGCTPQFTGDRPAAGHEEITICHQPGRKRWNGGGTRGVWTFPIELNRGGAHGPRLHTTPKPVPLMMELVRLFTDPGDIVLDPYCGAGATGVACLRLGRRFIGVELREDVARTAADRLVAEAELSTIHAARSGQVALFGGVQ